MSVVAYDNKSEVIIPAQYVTEKEALIARISAIEPRGCTALFDGVSAGATELRKFKGKCEISRVLLLSDGQANVGPSSPDELGRYGALLMKEGIAVSTIGLGVDYNEDLMTRLSQKSDGNSYFVENSNDLPRVFARELGDVLSVAATKVALKVRFCGGFVPVALIGRDGDEEITVESLAAMYGGFNYEIASCFTKRVPRVYYRGGEPVATMNYFSDFNTTDDKGNAIKADVSEKLVWQRSGVKSEEFTPTYN